MVDRNITVRHYSVPYTHSTPVANTADMSDITHLCRSLKLDNNTKSLSHSEHSGSLSWLRMTLEQWFRKFVLGSGEHGIQKHIQGCREWTDSDIRMRNAPCFTHGPLVRFVIRCTESERIARTRSSSFSCSEWKSKARAGRYNGIVIDDRGTLFWDIVGIVITN